MGITIQIYIGCYKIELRIENIEALNRNSSFGSLLEWVGEKGKGDVVGARRRLGTGYVEWIRGMEEWARAAEAKGDRGEG